MFQGLRSGVLWPLWGYIAHPYMLWSKSVVTDSMHDILCLSVESRLSWCWMSCGQFGNGVCFLFAVSVLPCDWQNWSGGGENNVVLWLPTGNAWGNLRIAVQQAFAQVITDGACGRVGDPAPPE